MNSSWGQNIKLTIFGESHAEAIGGVFDGFEAGLKLDFDEINLWLSKRKAGGFLGSTTRIEQDCPKILSGVKDGVTTGAPIAVVFENNNTKSRDYDNLSSIPRPSHADFAASVKYNGFADLKGGGHFSGRLTTPIVFFGALCLQSLKKRGVLVSSHILSIKDISDAPYDYCQVPSDLTKKLNEDAFPTISENIKAEMLKVISHAVSMCDSVGGVVETAVTGLPVGVGCHMFRGIENVISSIIFGIPAVKGISFGSGFYGTTLYGCENNDAFIVKGDKVLTATNNAGGINGGMSNGMPVIFSTAIKPTPSISKPQHSVDLLTLAPCELVIKGRHDACIVPRAVHCVSMATAIAIYDLMR